MRASSGRLISRRDALALLGMSALALACGRSPATPAPAAIAYGRDECDYCRMTIDDPALAAQHVPVAGAARRFGEVGCLLAWITREPSASLDGAAFVSVRGEWRRAESVRYWRGRSRTPMRFDITVMTDGAPEDGSIAWPTLIDEGTPRVHAT